MKREDLHDPSTKVKWDRRIKIAVVVASAVCIAAILALIFA